MSARPKQVIFERLRILGAPVFSGGRMLSDRPHGELHARGELRDWVRARGYRDHAADFLDLARSASNPDVKNRYVTIARHYLTLAEAEERSADRKSIERRSRPGQTTR
jgi:hypothetical protein